MKRAVVVLSIGRDMLCSASGESMVAAANRWGADFIVIRSPILGDAHPYWQKLGVYQTMENYDQVLQLDADMLVSRTCPDPFALVELQTFGVVSVDQPGSHPYRMRRKRAMQYWGERMSYPQMLPDTKYLNAGFMLYCPSYHKCLFNESLAYGADDYLPRHLPEQTVLSLCLDKRGDRIEWLPASFNRITKRRARSRKILGYIEHFVGGRKQARIECVDWSVAKGTEAACFSDSPVSNRDHESAATSSRCEPLRQPDTNLRTTNTTKTPKLAHFIWLGPKPLPSFGQDAIQSFKSIHSDWEVRLWRDLPEEMPGELRDAIDASPLFVHRADILRAWLLFKHGGFYFDLDFLFFRRIDELLSIGAMVMKTRRDITNAAMASPAGSAFFRSYLNLIVEQSRDGLPRFRNSYGPRALKSLIHTDANVTVAPQHWFALFSGQARRRFYKANEKVRSEMVAQKRHLIHDGIEPIGLHIGVGSRACVPKLSKYLIGLPRNRGPRLRNQLVGTQRNANSSFPSVASGDPDAASDIVESVARSVFQRSADRMSRFLFRHLGQPVFLICGDPSASFTDWTQVRQSGVPSMCVNNATRTYWPEMWVGIDHPRYFDSKLWEDDNVLKFTTFAQSKSPIPMNAPSVQTVAECRSTCLFKRTKPFCRDAIFGGDAGMPPLARRFTMACALRILYLLGFRHVFLIGADFYQTPESPYAYHQRVSSSSVKRSNAHFHSLALRFSMMRQKFENRGFHVYNCSLESRLKAFDLVPIRQALDIVDRLRHKLENSAWDKTLLGDRL